jgi:hypothetical protein
MPATTDTFEQWLTQAQIREPALGADQRTVLQAAFRFRQSQGTDYYSTRLLGHFLLHAGTGLKVAQIARLVGISRPTASRQQGLSAKEAIQQAHHRMDGRPYGKLLPRYAGPIAQCRYPHRVRLWKALPGERFESLEEPGPYTRAPAKEIRLAETTTVLRGEAAEQAVRTVVCREMVPGPKKDRWHPLFTTSQAEPLDVLTAFRARQHHEQGYRVGVYDEFLDAVPCGYDKESPNPQRPRFHRGPLQMIGWLVALVYNAVGDFAAALAEDAAGCHVRTLRRRYFNRPGTLYETPEALLVHLDPFAGQEALVPVIDRFNEANHRLPWLENRRVVLSLAPSGPAPSGP